jgi:hypothetical protein
MKKKNALSFSLGHHIRISFEIMDTIAWQILEMVRIEKGSSQQIKEEWACYSPLISVVDEKGFFILNATVMVEIHCPEERYRFLRCSKHLPFSLSIETPSGQHIKSNPVFENLDHEEKGSCVNFVRFILDPQTLHHGMTQNDDWLLKASLDDGTMFETTWSHTQRMGIFASFDENNHLLGYF